MAKQRRFSDRITSRAEKLTREFFSFFLNPHVAEYNYRPNWLFWKQANCELDIYYEMLSLAIEFNGAHHKLPENQQKDRFKKLVCEERNIVLFQITEPQQLLSPAFRFSFKQAMGIDLDHKKLPESLLKAIRFYRAKKSKSFTPIKAEKLGRHRSQSQKDNARRKQKLIDRSIKFSKSWKKEAEQERIRREAKANPPKFFLGIRSSKAANE